MLGSSYRFGRQDTCPPHLLMVDGSENWFYVTDFDTGKDRGLRPQAGIWKPESVKRAGSEQIPLVICTTSPHKGGTSETPWADIIRPDDGYVIYYGDNKSAENKDAAMVRGNRLMLEVMRLQHSEKRPDRALAPPILVVTTHGSGGLGKGFRRVEGIGVIVRAEVITQRHTQQPLAFQNLRFEIAILDLKDNHDGIPMSWLNARRSESSAVEEQLALAPKVWRRFVDEGMASVERLRRSVLRNLITPSKLQLPPKGSVLEDILERTLSFYEKSKHDFEAIAARVVERIFLDQGMNYRTGWLTPRSGDGGYDFVGRIDFDPGGGFPSSRQVVLGQAKCERSSTNGRDLARLAARLRRGWYGAYVTTANFSEPVQKEVVADKYPLLMVTGLRVASIVKDELDQTGQTLEDYLAAMPGQFDTIGLGLSDVESVLLQ